MTLDNILASLFPHGHDVVLERGLISGRGPLPDGGSVAVIGVDGRTPVGVEEAALLAGHVLDVIKPGGNEPILVLIDSDSQRMSKRDELLGLNEFLAHLAKCLILADKLGHRTIGLLYGHTAAGAFIATALATQILVALPGAEPAVMDLPSMSRVTKLSIDVLQEKAKSTPVFAPGLDNLAQTGAVAITLDTAGSLADQLQSVLSAPAEREDSRDKLGKERNGRPKAADIAERVYELARASV
ncbi:biotin-independent malonate decarboxylase subunit gamma [Dyella flava]|uniref:Biotin-independent malonate decarboxylase subunit gamma n=1 Tax=Dyella flava TaxID=1920170 RepID=A0ABS2K0H7_9GAMM|nr:biotin-independent malonate decarboxylase subunit gamma [Dyella flava]MBM7124105.1 biotin-independent malonate decarboxylase subunit gamma [Dyella flava]GLQ50006.1 biotin-independent malonate decarboxylase subunit gamma [Dyella flava]